MLFAYAALALRKDSSQKRLQQVIICRYGLGDQGPCTLKRVGAGLGVTGERVRQLQQEASAWLRQLVGKNTAADYRQALAGNAALRRARRKGMYQPQSWLPPFTGCLFAFSFNALDLGECWA